MRVRFGRRSSDGGGQRCRAEWLWRWSVDVACCGLSVKRESDRRKASGADHMSGFVWVSAPSLQRPLGRVITIITALRAKITRPS